MASPYSNDSGIRSLPNWCQSWVGAVTPFGICTYTEAELATMTKVQLQQVAKVNPELAVTAENDINTMMANADANGANVLPVTNSDMISYVLLGGCALLLIKAL